MGILNYPFKGTLSRLPADEGGFTLKYSYGSVHLNKEQSLALEKSFPVGESHEVEFIVLANGNLEYEAWLIVPEIKFEKI